MKKRFFLISSLVAITFLALFLLGNHYTAIQGQQKVRFTPAKEECFSVAGETPWKYCIFTPQNQIPNGDIAYLLHGRGHDEHTWNDATLYTAQMQQYWQSKKVSPPTVVTVSFGGTWILTPKASLKKSGLLDLFINEVIPEIEKKTGPPKSRLLFGESMGGMNSLVLAFRSKNLFKKVAALCPVIFSHQTPFSKFEDIQSFLKNSGAEPTRIYGILYLARDYFASDDEWNHFSPLNLIESFNSENAPKFYLSCGLYDKYGNYASVEELVQKSLAKGLNVEWHPLYGGHCAVDVTSVADFLVN